MLNRSQAPAFSSTESIALPILNTFYLSNGTPVNYISNSSLEVFKLELIFEAGTYYGSKFGSSYFTAKMMTAGTKFRTSAAVVEHFDNYGGFFEVGQNTERFVFTLHGLKKYFHYYLPMLAELLYDPVFPLDELEIIKNIASQSYSVNKEKSAFECGYLFKESLFGKETTFGKHLNPSEINTIEISDVIKFYSSYLENCSFKIYLSGNIDEDDFNKLDVYFGQKNLNTLSENIVTPPILSSTIIDIEKPDSLQKSLRMGKRLFNRQHPDFYKFAVFNTLFGGFFGSRLMKNIREDKGFTYGISSSLVPYAGEGYFVLGTDVKKDSWNVAIDEINKEIDILKNQTPSIEELDLVKNYMAGSIIGGINTVFDIMDKHKAIQLEPLPANFYETLLPKIKAVTALDISEMAIKYCNDLTLVTVG